MRPFALLTALLVLALPARAQDYPSRLIKLIQGFPPGGNVEFVARLLGHEMSKSLGQAIIVESKPGQAGSLAAEAVANAEPDGYTLLLVSGAHPATAAIYKKLKYDPVDAFAWISTASFYPFIVCVRSDSKWASFVDLLAAARAAPGKVSSGTAGNGSIAHMTTELIAKTAGVKFLSVPYRGEAMAVTGLLSGDVDFVLATAALAIPHVRSGVVKALAVTGKSRWKDIPEVATVAEQGLPDFEVISWSGSGGSGQDTAADHRAAAWRDREGHQRRRRAQQAGSGRQRSARDEPRRDARPRRSASQDVERGRARSQDRARLSMLVDWRQKSGFGVSYV